MLARISNNLYQAGRSLEQAEQLASYARVLYLAAMDTPYPEQKSELWDALLYMPEARQAYYSLHAQADEEKTLQFIALEASNPVSIRSCVSKAREKVREARDSVSADLWEYINRFYHSLQDHTAESIHALGFYVFAQQVETHAYTIKGYLQSAMMRKEEWRLLMLGYHLERATQLNILLLDKLRAIAQAHTGIQAEEFAGYQMRTLLEGLGAYEMYKHHYQNPLNKSDFIDFIIFNRSFPRSIAFNLQEIQMLGWDEENTEQLKGESFLRQVNSLSDALTAAQRNLPENNEIDFLEKNLKQLQALSVAFEEEQMAY